MVGEEENIDIIEKKNKATSMYRLDLKWRVTYRNEQLSEQSLKKTFATLREYFPANGM